MIPRRRLRAFSLVEVTLALGVMAFCLVALLGLLPVGMNSNRAALEQTAAASIASAVAVDLRQTPLYVNGSANYALTHPKSPRFQIPVPPPTSAQANPAIIHTSFFTEDGTVAGASGGNYVDQDAVPSQNPRYRVTSTFYPPINASNPSSQRTATLVRILVTWPALADPTAASTPVNFSGSFETMIALDRN
jgi:type II secretory pathway pseudopilin PulG